MPDWWKKKYNTIKVSVGIGEKSPSHVGLNALLSFSPELSLGGEALTREELENLMSQTAGLSFLKGKWVEIDHEKLRAALEAYDAAETLSGDGVTLLDAMRLQMGLGNINGLSAHDSVEISNGKWLSSILTNLKAPERLANVDAGGEFKATLRHYKQNGLDWLATMKNSGFGALLADDMGLGKTVQILAHLEYLRQIGEYKTLLIIPASLIGNWKAETERFAPKLRYCVLHGNSTEIIQEDFDLFITTYGMAVRLESLNTQKWDMVILDEAQAIKNPGTKQTKAVKSMPASFHIAMTGTPVENRMSDLWSLFDFLNAGLLGTSKEFSNYAKNIQSNEAYAKLRNVINPFILRRLKTDKTIISDLPDKVEMKIYGSLTKKQVVLYTALVKELAQTIDNLEGIERKGVVLASLMKFKQICNHPDQYLGQSVFDHTQSGKFKLLEEICETIHDKRERVLVFTQFREMCDPLSEYLETLFGKKGLILHGGTAVKKRAELVEKFNGDEYIPYMVLSLKAGGVGLNLTAANHVIHFDRWWNPAVENQATDRAFRIGQKKNVLVHKFVTTGTIEEKIDKMIEDKLKLSGELIASSGENWITEMDSKELMNLFRLEV
jgi:non-specific serine/threonine protein kinase